MTPTRQASRPAAAICQALARRSPDSINPIATKMKQVAVSGDIRPGSALTGVR